MKIENIRELCTGCSACQSVCPTKSIKMIMDDEGFYYPEINHESCIECGLCDRVCHCFNNSELEGEYRKSYYGRTKNPEILFNSSSGGAFYHIASKIKDEGGIVYGAAFDYNDLLLKHESTDDVSLRSLMKSKYVESDMNGAIEKIQKNINDGLKVLFCGTPCQVSGVKHAINDPENRLITCDFICHGVPSSLLLKEHINSIIKDEKLEELDFRSKEKGWTGKYMTFITRTRTRTRTSPYYLDTFYSGFMTYNAFLRKCCYKCRFRDKHVSDITIADFWGIKDFKPELNDEKGLSLIIANNELGNELVLGLKDFDLNTLPNCCSSYVYLERDYSEAYELRQKFYTQYKKYGFEKTAKIMYLQDLNIKRIKYIIKRLLKYSV